MYDKETVECMMEQIKNSESVTIHQASYFLKIALDGIESKSDLCDGDIEIIKNIRQMIKGL